MKHRVLVIEDNEQNMYMMTYLLDHAGLEVAQARNGAVALELAMAQAPDLIILDIQLPDMDGYEIAQRLKAEASLAEVPIVAVTSFAMSGDRERILAAGCIEYLEKPIEPDTFVERVSRHLPRRVESNE